MYASLIQRAIKGVSKGFGKFLAIGKDSSGNNKRLSSDQNAPQRKTIKDNLRNSLNEIAALGRAGENEILASELRKKVDE